jgi:phage-related protein
VYLSEYISKKKLNEKRIKILAKMDSVIKLTAEKNGIPGGEFSSDVIGYDFQELRIPDGSTLVRVLYFCYHRDKLVLLRVYDKPKLYEKAGKQRVDKKIKENNDIAQKYYEDFKKNPNQYEKYE